MNDSMRSLNPLRKTILSMALLAVLILCGVQPTAAADENQASWVAKFKQRLTKPQKLQTKTPLVFESPVPGAVVLYYQLYDGNWCYQHINKDTLIQALDTNRLSQTANLGQIQCFKRSSGF